MAKPKIELEKVAPMAEGDTIICPECLRQGRIFDLFPRAGVMSVNHGEILIKTIGQNGGLLEYWHGDVCSRTKLGTKNATTTGDEGVHREKFSYDRGGWTIRRKKQ